jgi:hypothetical protein
MTWPPGHQPGVYIPGTTVPIGAIVEQQRREQEAVAAVLAAQNTRRRRRHLLLLAANHQRTPGPCGPEPTTELKIKPCKNVDSAQASEA